MKKTAIFAVICLALVAGTMSGHTAPSHSAAAAPVLVELFTSEGCSDCPPADALLAKLDREQPIQGAQAIVLSEHVTYWDRLGWRDPYSSDLFTQRQHDYGDRFQLPSVYTPQMVVNGSTEFVGSDAAEAQRTIEKASRADSVPVQISQLAASPAAVRFRVHSGAASTDVDVFAVVALENATSSVRAGENSGRTLQYVAVARSLARVAQAQKGTALDEPVSLPLNSPGAQGLRLIVFLQEKATGKIVGVTMMHFEA